MGPDLYRYDLTADLEITAAEGAWTGTVCFGSAAMGARVEKFATAANNKGTTSLTVADGAYSFALDSTAEDSKSEGMRHYVMDIISSITMSSGVNVLEFDLKFDQMPVYSTSSIKNASSIVPGMNVAAVCDAASKLGCVFSISNFEDYGLAIMALKNWKRIFCFYRQDCKYPDPGQCQRRLDNRGKHLHILLHAEKYCPLYLYHFPACAAQWALL